MTKKITQKRLREISATTQARLDKYFFAQGRSWERHRINPSLIDLESRLINSTLDMERAVLLSILFKPHLTGTIQDFFTGRSSDFTHLAQILIEKDERISEDCKQDKYTEITFEDLKVLQDAELIVKRINAAYHLMYGLNAYGSSSYTNGLRAQRYERADNTNDTNVKYIAVQAEISQNLAKAAKPAQDILSTRIRRHGGKMKFSYVENLEYSLKGTSLGEEEVQALFNAIVDQVENSLNDFANEIVNLPELLTLKADLKSLHLQEHDFSDESIEDYLELE